MSKPSAIAASLVNMRNVGSHKSVALTIHVPEEQAHAVLQAFGWPTMVNPVPVAIARLNEGCQEPQSASVERPDLTGTIGFSIGGRSPPSTVTLGSQRAEAGPLELPDLGPATYSAHFAPDASEEEIAEASEWARRGNEIEDEKRAAASAKSKPAPAVQQAGIVCKEPEFWEYVRAHGYSAHPTPVNESFAASYVRAWCGVGSRAEITPGSDAEHLWNRLFLDYGEWRQRNAGA